MTFRDSLLDGFFQRREAGGLEKRIHVKSTALCVVLEPKGLHAESQPTENPAKFVPYREIGEKLFLQPVRVPDFQVRSDYGW